MIMVEVSYLDVLNPDWELHENKKFHWTQEVPRAIREIWSTFTHEQKVKIAGWAGALALQHERSYHELLEQQERVEYYERGND
jgi:hypothetical protein